MVRYKVEYTHTRATVLAASKHEASLCDITPIPGNKLTMSSAQVKSADMSEEMQSEAIEVAQEAMQKYNIEKDIDRKSVV